METKDILRWDNYMSVVFVLKLTVEGLNDYVSETLTAIHTQIYKKLSIGSCSMNCRKKYGRKFSKWRSSCSNWKYELERLNKCQRRYIQWEK